MERSKRFLLLAIFVNVCSTAFARVIDIPNVIIDATNTVATIIAIQLVCYSYLRFCKSRNAKKVKRGIIRIAFRLHERQWSRLLSAWVLSSFVVYVYAALMNFSIIILGFFVLLLFYALFSYYCCIVWDDEKRKERLTGKKALARLVSMFFQQAIGYIVVFVFLTPKFFVWLYDADVTITFIKMSAFPFFILFLVNSICKLCGCEQKIENDDDILLQTSFVMGAIKDIFIVINVLLVFLLLITIYL